MKALKPAIVVFPASNCERDMAHVLRDAYQLDPIFIWHRETIVPCDVTHVILPGGFSFGDYVRAGAIAAVSPIMAAIKKCALEGLPVLGICNGFQILCEAQLLPGILLKNLHDRFVCKIESLTWFGMSSQLNAPRSIRLPIAHGEGRYYADQKTLDALRNNGQIALTYDVKDEVGNAQVNGASESIAGIVAGPRNNILGLMPHPERMAKATTAGIDGLVILDEFLFGEMHEKKDNTTFQSAE